MAGHDADVEKLYAEGRVHEAAVKIHAERDQSALARPIFANTQPGSGWASATGNMNYLRNCRDQKRSDDPALRHT